MTPSLTETFYKYKNAFTLRKETRALAAAGHERDTDAILTLLDETPALLDAPLEFVPGQVERLTIFDYLLRVEIPPETIAAVVAAYPQLMTQTDKNGDTLALRYYRESTHPDALKRLSDIIPHKVTANKDGDTLLHIAAGRQTDMVGNDAAMRHALHKNPFINARNNKGQTPLMIAAANGGVFATKSLLDSHADIHATDNDGRNALMHAIRRGALDSAALLLQKGSVIDFSDPNVNALRRVAKMEAHADFLQAFQVRRETQASEDKVAQKQEAFRLRTETLKGMERVVKAGTGRIRAPKTASFTKK